MRSVSLCGSITLLVLSACASPARTGVTPSERAGLEARREMTEAARRALRDEQALTSMPPVPRSIAVLPWTYLGRDSVLIPLGRGLAHLMIADLAKLPRFVLLERERVQALTDEMALAGSSRFDSATAARSGRLLRAEQVVSGVLQDADHEEIRLDASVVSAKTSEVRATSAVSDRLGNLFAMEKALVFDLIDRMGISLTPAERQALSERPTADLQSFLAFSRGLMAEDRGDWPAAARAFEAASAADPGFRAAQVRASRSVVVSRQAGSVRRAGLAAAIQSIAPSLGGRLKRSSVRNAAARSRLAEALRQDDPTRLGTTGLPVITIPRP